MQTPEQDGNVAIFDTQNPEGSIAVKAYKVARGKRLFCVSCRWSFN